MDGEHVFVGGKPMNVYTDVQVRDVLEEAHRLEIITGRGVMTIAVRKLDSLNHGRMDA